MGAWQPVRTADGSWTLRHPVHGQACHSLAGAWQEARERYAAPCRLRELALERARGAGPACVRLLDVGTGLGLNLAAAWLALEGTGVALEATTLERDASVPLAAAGLPPGPPEMARWQAPLRGLLARLAAAGGGEQRLPAGGVAVPLQIRLRLGDARRTLPTLAGEPGFDAVFLDPFSPSVEPELWQVAFLREVGERMDPLGVLSTYSSALSVRRALAAAGLRVGAGPAVGTKASGTLASPSAALPPLPERAARRLRHADEGPPRPGAAPGARG